MEAEYLEAEYNSGITKLERTPSMVYSIHHKDIKNLSFELRGDAQKENIYTILTALSVLKRKLNISDDAIQRGLANVVELTGLQGRWQTLQEKPFVVCDTGHNEAGIKTIVSQLSALETKYKRLYIILGMAADKDVRVVLKLFPKHYNYYFTRAQVSRALPERELQKLASEFGLKGEACSNVASAFKQAQQHATEEDLIFIGGSNFVVADLLSILNTNNTK